MNAQITIFSEQRLDGEAARTTHTAAGTVTPGDVWVIAYTETDEDGEQTAVTVSAGRREVTVERVGAARSRLEFRRGATCPCRYGTPYGELAIVTRTHTLQNRLAEEGLLELAYTLELGGGESHHTLRLVLQKQEESQ